MAFTQSEKELILYNLGYNAQKVQESSEYFSRTTDDILDNVTETVEKLIQDLLADIDTVREALRASRKRFSAKSVDNIRINEDEDMKLKGELVRLQTEIGSILGIARIGSGGIKVRWR